MACAASMSPCRKAFMLKSCVMISTVDESSPSAAMAAKISHSLPKPHEPIFFPSKSATLSIPESAQDTWSVPERWKIWAMLVTFAPASIEPSTLGTHAIA
jgi:hypothetical protein